MVLIFDLAAIENHYQAIVDKSLHSMAEWPV
jgi:hypothetical protein